MAELGRRPSLKFKKLKDEDRQTAVFFGVENEIEFPTTQRPSSICTPVDDSRFYCVSDCSIRNGIEFLSHPMTWKWIQKYWHHWSDLMEYIKSKQGDGSDRCGIHIHFSRHAINGQGIIKMHKLFVSNKALMANICGRKENNYCYYRDTVDAKRKAERHDNKQTYGDKYSAINTCHNDTIEIRTFKGTSDPRKILKYLTFVKSCIDYVMSPVPLADVSFPDYFLFIERHKEEYPEMYAWILRNSTANRMLETVSVKEPIPVSKTSLNREFIVEECC